MARILMYEVICSNAFPTKDGWIASGEHLRIKTADAEQAVWLAAELCKASRSVVLRPDFNERNKEVWYFREWRSINGEPLKEVRWLIGEEDGQESEPANAVVKALLTLRAKEITG